MTAKNLQQSVIRKVDDQYQYSLYSVCVQFLPLSVLLMNIIFLNEVDELKDFCFSVQNCCKLLSMSMYKFKYSFTIIAPHCIKLGLTNDNRY